MFFLHVSQTILLELVEYRLAVPNYKKLWSW